jgi:ribosomal protein S18 acetylase RimI-like enzyme
VIEVAISDMDRRELPFAVGALARGMCDNPNPVAALGGDRLSRVAALQRVFGVMMRVTPQEPLVARRGDWIVGVCGMLAPGKCQPSPANILRLAPTLLRLGPSRATRLNRWMKEWGERDPQEPHWHLGPVAVEPGLQGMTVGSQMMKRFCEKMDAEREMAYLETEKPENVRFYERFGFETTAEVEVLGNRNWFMRREARNG